MASLTDAQVAYLVPAVEKQAQKVAARYENVEAEDLAQELWVWIMEESSPALKKYIDDDLPQIAHRALYNAAVRWCEQDKKRRMREAGINWRDQYTYTRPEVAKLLPLALDPASIPGMSGQQLHDGPAARNDPAYGGGMLAAIADVRFAFSKLSESDQRFVGIVIGLDTNWDQISRTTGIRANSAYAKWMRILDRMVTRHLGRKTDADDDDE